MRVFGVPPVGADRVGPLEVREHEDVEKLGAGSGAEGVETVSEPLFEFIRLHECRLGDRLDMRRWQAVGPRRAVQAR